MLGKLIGRTGPGGRLRPAGGEGRRYDALLIGTEGMARLVRECDGRTVLAEAPFAVDPECRYHLSLAVGGTSLKAMIDGSVVVEAANPSGSLPGGGVDLAISEGTPSADPVRIERLG